MTHTTRLKTGRARASALAATAVVLGLGACTQAGTDTANPLAGLNEQRALGDQFRIADGVCFQRTNDEKGWFITNPQKCITRLGRS
ncbi:MAG: hypothetical protein AAF899_16730 [Pseudomonadota bacterium]